MNKNKGLFLYDLLIKITLFILISNLGFLKWKDYQEKILIEQTKVNIYELFSTYGVKASNLNEKYFIKMDYLKKEIVILSLTRKKLETLYLPKNLRYTTIFNNLKQDIFEAEITTTGNITPSFSIYIFDSNNIARYRISLYSFDIIKYLKINIYKNLNDNKAIYNNISNFHKIWTTTSKGWKEE